MHREFPWSFGLELLSRSLSAVTAVTLHQMHWIYFQYYSTESLLVITLREKALFTWSATLAFGMLFKSSYLKDLPLERLSLALVRIVNALRLSCPNFCLIFFFAIKSIAITLQVREVSTSNFIGLFGVTKFVYLLNDFLTHPKGYWQSSGHIEFCSQMWLSMSWSATNKLVKNWYRKLVKQMTMFETFRFH